MRSGGQEPAHARRRTAVTVAGATAAFAAALAGRDLANVWLVTGAAAVASLALAGWSDGARLVRLLSPPRPLAAAALGIASGAVLVALTHLLYPLALAAAPALAGHVTPLYADLQHPPGPLAALPVTLLAVLAEECVWRGAALGALRERLGLLAAGAAALALYVVPHALAGNPALFAAALALGAAWTALRLWRGDLLAPLLCHLTWSLSIFQFLPLPAG